MRGKKKQRVKTIPIDGVSSPWICPIHAVEVERRVRRTRDDKGRDEFKGTYYGCPHYQECGYYIDGSMKNVADVGQDR